MIFDKNRWP